MKVKETTKNKPIKRTYDLLDVTDKELFYIEQGLKTIAARKEISSGVPAKLVSIISRVVERITV